MATQMPPLILVDNLFDRINLYPLATLSSTGDALNRPVQAVANYRRERDYWQAAAAGAAQYVQVDLGVGNTSQPDALWIDRGHNLWGKTVQYRRGNGGTLAVMSRVVPAAGTVGGDPEAGWSVTEEGAIYTLFPAGTADRYHCVEVLDNYQPIITGLILGRRTQLLSYSAILDDDMGDRVQQIDESDAGYEGRSRAYSYRRLPLQLSEIGATEYDTMIRLLRRTLFEIDQPAFIVQNYGRWPERGWLYRFSGNRWSFSTNKVYRRGTMEMREVGALIR